MQISRGTLALLLLLAAACSAAPVAEGPSAYDAGKDAAFAVGTDAGKPEASVVDAEAPEVCDPLAARAVPLTLAVTPDDGEEGYLAVLREAKTSVRMFAYMLGAGGVLDAIVGLAHGGVDVRVIADGNSQRDINEKYRLQLEAAGAKFRYSDPKFSYMHAKVLIVDERLATISTGNYSRSYLQKERNFIARDEDPADVVSLRRLFDADWNAESPNLSCTRLVVSPVNAKERILELIGSAKQSIAIESMQYADSDVRAKVLERKSAGIEVRVLLASADWISANQSAATSLAAAGIAVKYRATPALHVKAIVVDGARIYLGSENLSQTSLERNREVGLLSAEPAVAGKMMQVFETDWQDATSF